jgi:quercetin dioxygenase-like cupin family protein
MKITSLNDLEFQAVSHNPQIRKKTILQKGDVPHLVYFSQAIFPPGEIAAAHFHPDLHEIFFVESGQGSITINGNNYPLLPGNCITVNPGEVHELVNNGDVDLIITYFSIQG